jgi:S-adenosylmethionine decarboxylase
MQGLHLTADLYQCQCDDAWLTDEQRLGDWCLQAVGAAGLQPLAHLFRRVAGAAGEPGGVSGAVLLAGSHVCLHASAQERMVVADVYFSPADEGHTGRARALMDAVLERFQPAWTEQRSLDRGDGQ